jgi:hypothetical protein
MKEKTKDTLVDKLIDIVVVILGILIALNIDSYVETQKQKKQWKSFATQFYTEATEDEKNMLEVINFYENQLTETNQMIGRIFSDKKDIEGFDEYLNSLPAIRISYPDPSIYQGFLRLGNEFLLRDTNTVKALGEYYAFEAMAMTNFNSFSDHFVGEYKKLITKYYTDEAKGVDSRRDLASLLISFTYYCKHAIDTYKAQETRRQKVIDVLEPVIN